MKLLKKSLLISLLAVFAMACKDDNTARLVVNLTDSPGDYDEVNIDLTGVQVHRSAQATEDGWIDLDANTGMYNLLDLTDGVTTVIADSKIPAGSISQIRLVLGNNSTVVVDGVEFSLTTPSAYTSGAKLLVNETLLEGITYTILLDFDAAKSVVRTGGTADKYNLKPVIRTVTVARDGAIEGTVVPASENVAVYAMQGVDTVATSYAIQGNSAFFIGGLDAGVYDLVFDPGDSSTYASQVIETVNVNIGEINNVGETTLQLK